MNIEVELEDGPMALFAQYLAEQKDMVGGDIGEYFFAMVIVQANIHPDWRECPNLECCYQAWPTCTVKAKPYVPNPKMRYTVSTAPTEICPECGAATVTLAEALNIHGADRDYSRRILALAALEREHAKAR